MDTHDVTRLLDAALDRWADNGGTGAARDVEVLAYASLARELHATARELHEIRLTMQARHEEAIDRAENLAQRRRSEGAETSAHRAPESHVIHTEPPRQYDEPCLETQTQKGGTQTYRCTRRQGHAGEHVDATGRRWGEA